MSHSDARTEADISFGLDSVELGQDATSVWCQCGEDFTVTTSEQENKHPQLTIICSLTKQINYDKTAKVCKFFTINVHIYDINNC